MRDNHLPLESAGAHRVDGGFSLLEIMAVVVIMGLLMSIIGVSISGQIDKARLATARAQIAQLESALELYRMDNGRYPTTAQGLVALVEKPGDAPQPRNYPRGGYLSKADALLDPWSEPYQYASPGDHNRHGFDLWTQGADQAPGGEDGDSDIGNWESGTSGA
jgi:general secretion pathway protein G